MIKFNWKRTEPEDFIVKEIAEHEISENGKHFLYLLVKRNLTTKELARKLNFSYAGMKDKISISSQFITFETFKGDFLKKTLKKDSWFILKFIGRKSKKLKVGQLKGNRFAINLKNLEISEKSWFINYYDIQRLKRNKDKGKELLRKLIGSPEKKLKWIENFYIDSYLSFLWNKSLETYLKEKTEGYFIAEAEEEFFIPENIDISKLPKFWTILGYKKKLLESELYYSTVLQKEGFSLNEFLSLLKHLKIKGDYRMTYINVKELKKIGNHIFFYLPKGAYATMFLKHLQKQ
ncbi:tRNA pseudouridine(13) synthase TruD [Desulfurobacterium atlanticum]|uniref:tRNA pseudouridine13 synthase n=1 Tax=Desulfurobacterium atlanticum TaxID=240169 RepID=A0A239A434_9BACT|nr:tRNA pseudouridine(13) synthase TruD [Desulfurobacterium atlanticum]SNR90249.1 tRNA pseudouridine13 synthase [Desulfurobacterium atlanticum]